MTSISEEKFNSYIGRCGFPFSILIHGYFTNGAIFPMFLCVFNISIKSFRPQTVSATVQHLDPVSQLLRYKGATTGGFEGGVRTPTFEATPPTFGIPFYFLCTV